MTISHDSSLGEFINIIEKTSAFFRMKGGAELRASLSKLEAYGIITVGDLWGSLNPELPDLSDANSVSRRCLRREALKREGVKPGTELATRRVRKLAHAVDLHPDTVRLLVERIRELPNLYQYRAPSRSLWYLGQRERRVKKRQSQQFRFINTRTLTEFNIVKPQAEPVLLEGLNSRIGQAWDQGERGTCAAQATGALMSYLNRGVLPSVQFLYHQCKLIDGEPKEEGTYLETAFRVISDRGISGAKYGEGNADMGLPEQGAWPYVTKYESGNPSQSPPPERHKSALYQGKRWFGSHDRQEFTEIICCSEAKTKIVDEIRFIIKVLGAPVVIGMPLYESFNNENSRRTGKITLPLPGEALFGYHAMLIVGFDDQAKVFIVRNSWGPSWAWNCRYESESHRLSGHAIIPYNYFRKQGISRINGLAIRKTASRLFRVEEHARLYNKINTEKPQYLKAARRLTGRKSQPARKHNNIKKTKKHNKNFFDFLKV